MPERKTKPITIDENSYDYIINRWGDYIGREVYFRIMRNRDEKNKQEVKDKDARKD